MLWSPLAWSTTIVGKNCPWWRVPAISLLFGLFKWLIFPVTCSTSQLKLFGFAFLTTVVVVVFLVQLFSGRGLLHIVLSFIRVLRYFTRTYLELTGWIPSVSKYFTAQFLTVLWFTLSALNQPCVILQDLSQIFCTLQLFPGLSFYPYSLTLSVI